jgi:hypothetical protein
MQGSEKKRDAWDWLDLGTKVTSGVLLAGIAIFIKMGTDEIAAAHRRGDMVRNLISDLTTKEARTRQDLALIALNHSIGDQDVDLMTEIAERLVFDTAGYSNAASPADQPFATVAFRILEQRNKGRADSLRSVLRARTEAIASVPETRAALRSSPDSGHTRAVETKADSSAAAALTQLVTPIQSRIVFIQFQGDLERPVVQQLRQRFNSAGFVSPDVERVTSGQFNSSVRYFHPEDAATADSVAEIARTFVQQQRLRVPSVPVLSFAGRGFNAPRGQVEVWISVR